MRHLKMVGLAAVAVAALMAFASSASATTLEVTGETQTKAVSIEASIAPGGSAILKDTSGFAQNTCTGSVVKGKTEVFSGTSVTGKLSSLTFSGCTRTVTVHQPGALEIIWVPNTTNGTVYSEEAQVTSGSPVGTLNCTTGGTSHIGTLTGVESGNGTMHINALINCGIIPSAKWEGTYTVTTHGIGVVK